MKYHLSKEISSINPEQQGKVAHVMCPKHRAFKENTTFVNIRELSRGPPGITQQQPLAQHRASGVFLKYLSLEISLNPHRHSTEGTILNDMRKVNHVVFLTDLWTKDRLPRDF